MYNSGILTGKLIENITDEADITIPVDSDSWYRWINSVEQFVYTEIFNMHRAKTFDYTDDTINMSDSLGSDNGTAVPDFDDIIKVYADDTELDRAGVISAHVFTDKPLYYTDYSGNIMVNAGFVPEKITVIYRIRPALKYADEESYINLPIEFVDMLAARLRAEAYKLANDDAQGAKWMMDYNTQLETLKVWASMRNVRYGE